MKEEVMKKIRAASTAEELLSLAKEENIELSQEEAEALLSNIKEASSELDDSELDNVSGGACTTTIGSHKYKVVTSNHSCNRWDKGYYIRLFTDELVFHNDDNRGLRKVWFDISGGGSGWDHCCGNCIHLQFKGSTGICDIPID